MPKPLDQIFVPEPLPDEEYHLEFFGRGFSFRGLKRLLGAADHSKAGDRAAGLAAATEVEREAARTILSSLTLQHLYDRPLTDDLGKVDSVMRVNYDIDRECFSQIANWTVGDLKNFLLREPAEKVKVIGAGLTGVMAAAVAKLMDVHELVLAAKKLTRTSKARTQIGCPGYLSSRLQPNHPVDDLRSVSFLVYAGLSLGAGDSLIGMNPAVDNVEHISKLLNHLARLRETTGAPTQVCVLAHIKTQIACLKQGAPVEIMFQSLAGTDATCVTEFDVDVATLDAGYELMATRGPLKGTAENWMYFETGQGSEYTYQKHNGTDMATLEALCYGLARRYRPFMVNNVTGFIGPETHADDRELVLSNLQDHFMGKLLGLSMGMAPCYTLHAGVTLEGQQICTELLTAAGANYYMDVYLNTDRMLAYFDTSGHDNQTLREIYGKRTTPEFESWAIERGIFASGEDGAITRGPEWGNPRIFCSSEMEFQDLKKATPSVFSLSNAGPRPSENVSREVRLHQAAARAAVWSDLDRAKLGQTENLQWLKTQASRREAHLMSPALGSVLATESEKQLMPENKQVQILVSDGLSAEAVNANFPEIWPVIQSGLTQAGISLGSPKVAEYGRVKLGESVARATDSELLLYLIGERPGGDARAARSLSCYFIYRLKDPKAQQAAAAFSRHPEIEFEYSVLSNIYPEGIPPVEAGAVIVERSLQILASQAAGNRLEAKLRGI